MKSWGRPAVLDVEGGQASAPRPFVPFVAIPGSRPLPNFAKGSLEIPFPLALLWIRGERHFRVGNVLGEILRGRCNMVTLVSRQLSRRKYLPEPWIIPGCPSC